MDKVQKFDHTKQIDEYLEKHEVRQMFSGLLKQLLVKKPANPLEFLIDQLSSPVGKRIILMEAFAYRQKEVLEYCDKDSVLIDCNELLLEHVVKCQEYKEHIQRAILDHEQVPDDVVIDVVKKRIQELEKHSSAKTWLIVGFPRTKAQALSLGELGIIPDKIISSTISADDVHAKETFQDYLMNNLTKCGKPTDSYEAKVLVERKGVYANFLEEYALGLKGVKSVQNDYIIEVNPKDRMFNLDVIFEKNLQLIKNKKKPGIVLVGPPGSGKSTQAQLLSYVYGFVNVNAASILESSTLSNPELAKVVRSFTEKGEMVPDHIMLPLLQRRLQMNDCQAKGWVLDGFPSNEAQINLLTAMQLKHTHVIMLDIELPESVNRLKYRKVDILTGKFYNKKMLRLEQALLVEILQKGNQVDMMEHGLDKIDPEIAQAIKYDRADADTISLQAIKTLKSCPEDAAPLVQKRYQAWNSNLSAVEEYFGSQVHKISADKKMK